MTPRKPVRVRLVLIGGLIASIGGGLFKCISRVTRRDTDHGEAAE